MRRRFFFTFLLFGILLSGCFSSRTLSDDLDIYKTGKEIFRDDFSIEDNQWSTGIENESLVEYVYGGIQIIVNQPYIDAWTTLDEYYVDTRITVDASKIKGPDNNAYGIVCRYQNPNNYYAFLISSDGYAAVMVVENGIHRLISSPQMQYFDAIIQGSGPNQLEAICDSSVLALSVNYQQLIQIQDTRHTEGKIGLIASSQDSPGVAIFFDNYVVYNP